ncbi:MAG: hypothetical protein WKF58_04910 [Ilumatobacteraceae bacterium]
MAVTTFCSSSSDVGQAVRPAGRPRAKGGGDGDEEAFAGAGFRGRR